jgi:mannose-6-phosphate isomerase-like protein (cupin superfamily)
VKLRSLLSIPFLLLTISVTAQTITGKTLKPDSTNYENVYVKSLYSDSLSSTFAIWIKKQVKPHKHVNHSEVVTVLEGKAEMTVDGETRIIKKGDVIILPKGTVHSVVTKSRKPLLVLSIQAPKFVGKDRVWVN